MDWIEVTVHTTTEGSDLVSEELMREGANGTMVEDRADVPDPDKPNGYWELIDPKLIGIAAAAFGAAVVSISECGYAGVAVGAVYFRIAVADDAVITNAAGRAEFILILELLAYRAELFVR